MAIGYNRQVSMNMVTIDNSGVLILRATGTSHLLEEESSGLIERNLSPRARPKKKKKKSTEKRETKPIELWDQIPTEQRGWE